MHGKMMVPYDKVYKEYILFYRVKKSNLAPSGLVLSDFKLSPHQLHSCKIITQFFRHFFTLNTVNRVMHWHPNKCKPKGCQTINAL